MLSQWRSSFDEGCASVLFRLQYEQCGRKPERGPTFKTTVALSAKAGGSGVSRLARVAALLPLNDKDLWRANANCNCGDAWSSTRKLLTARSRRRNAAC